MLSPAGGSGDALEIQSLRFSHSGVAGAHSWSLSVDRFMLAQGEQVLLTGGSGRGKSTLLHLIAGLVDPDSGSIAVAGQIVHRLHGAARDRFRGRHLGMIFQTFNLLQGFTALENVMIALMFSDVPAREHADRARRLLADLGIDKHGHTPDRLSVGQQQRIAVARALACDPVIVLADEPTASLDPANAKVAIDLIRQVCRDKGAALLCTSHDPTLPSIFERHVSIDDLSNSKAVG